jgi:hypothetical protein
MDAYDEIIGVVENLFYLGGSEACCTQTATPAMTNVAPIIVKIGRSTGSFKTNQLVQMENTSDNALQAGTAIEISVCDNVT